MGMDGLSLQVKQSERVDRTDACQEKENRQRGAMAIW